MNGDEIKEYLADFQKKEIPSLIERNLKIPDTSSNKIISIIGPRRAGKTYLFYQKIQNLIREGVKKESIIYLNFEDPRLSGINYKEVHEIIKIHWQAYPESKNTKIYVFIDEPQNVEKWEVAVRSLHDDGYKLFLTGSSSKLLSKEIATSLRGRTLAYTLLPFSFDEYLEAKNVKLNINSLSSKEKSEMLQMLDEYLLFGGYPEVVLEKNDEIKLSILKEYFNLTVYKDVIERHKVRNSNLIKWMIHSLVSSFAKEYSIYKIYLTLKSQGIKASKNTLYTYISFLEDSNFAFALQKFKYSIRKRELGVSKIYLCDTGYARLVETSKDTGRKIENSVFLQLVRKSKDPSEIYYWRNVQQEEVDFVICQGNSPKSLIQCVADISDPDTKKREIVSLLKAAKELKCNDLIVVTYYYEAEEEHEWFGTKGKIKFIPLWKWLLKD